MPFYAVGRRKFGDLYIEHNGEVPILPGRNYAKMERQGIIRWQKDAAPEAAEVKGAPVQPASADQPAVEIPADWRDLHWSKQKVIASHIAPDAEIKGKAEAVAIIEAEVARREAALGDEGRDDKSVNIPADWRDLPDEQRVFLAKELTGETYDKVEDADAAIELEAETRKAASE